MAYPSDYAGWIDKVRDFLDVDDFDNDRIGGYLSLAQTRLNRELNSQWMEKNATLITTVFATAIPIVASAPDYNRVRLVMSDANPNPLDVLAFNEFKKMTALNLSGMPLNYAIEGQSLYMYPYPGVDSVATLYYYIQVPEISASVPSNIFTDHHPDALLYASVLEGSRFIVEDERIPTWNDAYNQALISSNEVAKSSKLGSTPLKRNITMYKVG